MNHISRNDNDLVAMHREAVVGTLATLMRTSGMRNLPAEKAIDDFYDSLNLGEREMLLHQEPFDTACNLAGIEGTERKATFDRVRHSYGAMMGDFDARADATEQSRGAVPTES